VKVRLTAGHSSAY